MSGGIPGSRSRAWYLLPLLFPIFGSLIAYFAIRADDPKKAKNSLALGFIVWGTMIALIGVGVYAISTSEETSDTKTQVDDIVVPTDTTQQLSPEKFNEELRLLELRLETNLEERLDRDIDSYVILGTKLNETLAFARTPDDVYEAIHMSKDEAILIDLEFLDWYRERKNVLLNEYVVLMGRAGLSLDRVEREIFQTEKITLEQVFSAQSQTVRIQAGLDIRAEETILDILLESAQTPDDVNEAIRNAKKKLNSIEATEINEYHKLRNMFIGEYIALMERTNHSQDKIDAAVEQTKVDGVRKTSEINEKYNRVTTLFDSKAFQLEYKKNINTQSFNPTMQCKDLQNSYGVGLLSCRKYYNQCAQIFHTKSAIRDCIVDELPNLASSEKINQCYNQFSTDRLLLTSCIKIDSLDPHTQCNELIESGTIDYWVKEEKLGVVEFEQCVENYKECYTKTGDWLKGLVKCLDNPQFTRQVTPDEIQISNIGN